jgi:hypothetical protein
MRYQVNLVNPETAVRIAVLVRLADEEIAKSGGSELYLCAFALRHAYQNGPAGFVHDGVPRLVRH